MRHRSMFVALAVIALTSCANVHVGQNKAFRKTTPPSPAMERGPVPSGAPPPGFFAVRMEKPVEFTLNNLADADRIYFAACDVMQRELGTKRPLRPAFRLVLGAEANQLSVVDGEAQLRLQKWDRSYFAQAVVIMAYGQVLGPEELARLARLALASADAAVGVEELKK